MINNEMHEERITLAVIGRDIKALTETMRLFMERFEVHLNENSSSFQRQGERIEAMRMEIAVLQTTICELGTYTVRISELEKIISVLKSQVENTEKLKWQISSAFISNVIAIVFAGLALVMGLMK
jgi:archaellum component FlaC